MMDGHCDNSNTADFDLNKVAVLFRRSLLIRSSANEDSGGTEKIVRDNAGEWKEEEEDAVDVLLADYIEAYNELNKMFPKLGRLFSFVASDVADKTRILSDHQLSAVGDKYGSIGGVLDYEKNEGKLLDNGADGRDLPNGSRTLLRLHRALLFVVQFMDNIRQSKDEEKMAQVARKAYDDTLSRYHPWLVRKGVHLAIYTLPNRHQLLVNIAGSDVTSEQAERVMEETAAAGRAVYNVTQKLYEKHQLLDLP